MKPYLTCAKAAQAEYVEKKSRFIGMVFPVQTEDEARAIIEKTRKQHYDARHCCFCYIIKNGPVRYSDDGEPQGTAGQPMLSVFEHGHIENVLCVVVRYFGGVLLGTGGLVRAYSKAAKDALDAAGIAQYRAWDRVDVWTPYAFYDRVKLELAAQGGVIEDTEYGADILLHAMLPQENTAACADALREMTAGRVRPTHVGSIYRAVLLEK